MTLLDNLPTVGLGTLAVIGDGAVLSLQERFRGSRLESKAIILGRDEAMALRDALGRWLGVPVAEPRPTKHGRPPTLPVVTGKLAFRRQV